MFQLQESPETQTEGTICCTYALCNDQLDVDVTVSAVLSSTLLEPCLNHGRNHLINMSQQMPYTVISFHDTIICNDMSLMSLFFSDYDHHHDSSSSV